MTHAPQRPHLHLSGPTRHDTGLQRGTHLRDQLADMVERYFELFRVVGSTDERIRAGAEETLETLAAWRPERIEEFAGIAEGAGLELWHVAAINARTEILGTAAQLTKECSTVAGRVGERQLSVQTWDWHIELDAFWHTQQVSGFGHAYAGLTEHGIISKIGINDAGLGLHFNILGHEQDGTTGIPMHVLSAVVLEECGSVDEAIALLQDAPIGSSSAFTLIDAEQSVSVELTPAGVFRAPLVQGFAVRTNHFQTPEPARNEKTHLYYDDSVERFDFVVDRLARATPADERELVALLSSAPGEPALCCVPDMSKALGDRWATLATVVLDPHARTLRALAGSPRDAASGVWHELSAAG